MKIPKLLTQFFNLLFTRENLIRMCISIAIVLAFFVFTTEYAWISILVNFVVFGGYEGYKDITRDRNVKGSKGGSPWSFFMGFIPAALFYTLIAVVFNLPV